MTVLQADLEKILDLKQPTLANIEAAKRKLDVLISFDLIDDKKAAEFADKDGSTCQVWAAQMKNMYPPNSAKASLKKRGFIMNKSPPMPTLF